MGRGRRYDPDQSLNLKKVFAVIIAIVVIIMFVVAINTILKQDVNNQNQSNVPLKYYSACTNDKWGVINSKGEFVIQPTYNEMIIVPNNDRKVFLCVYDVNYDNGAYKTKAINESETQLYTEYTGVEALENCDTSNIAWYEENVLRVEKDGKYGLINLDGEVILGCEYSKIDVLKGYKNKIVTQKDNLYGLVDNYGAILVNNECESEEQVMQKCVAGGTNLELTVINEENSNPKNIGKWHISKDDNCSYYTDN